LEINEIVQPKAKRGRPNGSGKKQKDVAPEVNQSLTGDFLGNNDAGIGAVTPVALESERTTLAGAEDAVTPAGNKGGTEAVTPKRRGRPKGSKKEKKRKRKEKGTMEMFQVRIEKLLVKPKVLLLVVYCLLDQWVWRMRGQLSQVRRGHINVLLIVATRLLVQCV
jgi:hypothetical protein